MAYILMALAGLIPAALVIGSRRDPALLATWLFASGAVMAADWLAFGMLGLYDYQPGLFGRHAVDAMAGVILSEMIFVASIAVLQVRYLPGWRGLLAATLTFTLIEILFIRWGIFWHGGWPHWVTPLLFPPYLWVVGRYHRWAEEEGLARGGPRFLVQNLSIFLVISLYTSGIRLSNMMVTDLQVFSRDVANASLVRLLFYGMITVPVGHWTLLAGRVGRWQRLPMAVLFLYGALYLAGLIGFLKFKPPWHPVLDALGQGLTISLVFFIDDWLTAWAAPQRALR